MRAINHALTGAIIGIAVGEPLIAIPAAVASHFICDALPHYDGVNQDASAHDKKIWLRSRAFKLLLYTDALLCFVLVAILAGMHPVNWLLAAICAFAAASPDFLWIPRYINRNRNQKPVKLTGFNKFAFKIQWFQRPIGSVVEAAWFVASITVLMPFLR